MRADTIFFVFILLMIIVDSIFFVIFGQKAVRKLRKNPKTKDALGIEFMNGWDIVNVTIALGFPRKLNRFLRKSAYAPLNTDADLISKHLTRFDLVLAKIHFSLWMLSAAAILLLMLLDSIGVFR